MLAHPYGAEHFDVSGEGLMLKAATVEGEAPSEGLTVTSCVLHVGLPYGRHGRVEGCVVVVPLHYGGYGHALFNVGSGRLR